MDSPRTSGRTCRARGGRRSWKRRTKLQRPRSRRARRPRPRPRRRRRTSRFDVPPEAAVRARRGRAPPAPAHARTLGRQPPVVAEPAHAPPRRREEGSSPSPPADAKPEKRRRKPSPRPQEPPRDFGVMDTVEGNWNDQGRWYTAVVEGVFADGTINLKYVDGDKETRVPPSSVRPLPKRGSSNKGGGAARLPKRRLPRRPRARRSRRPSRVLHGNRATTTTSWTTRLLMYPCRGAG